VTNALPSKVGLSGGLEDPFSRRDFVLATAAAFGSLGLTRGAAAAVRELGAATALPPPARSGIDHIVVVMMENRSFDHFLGWLPGGDGKQAGLSYIDAKGVAHSTHPLAPDFQGCAHPGPDHSYAGGRIQYNNGACDGFLRSGQNDEYAIGYYSRRDLPFLGAAARYWTVCDRYFAAIMGPDVPELPIPARRRHGPHRQHLHVVQPADNLGSARRSRPERPDVLQQCPNARTLGREVRLH
jgi:phosphoesterase family protein